MYQLPMMGNLHKAASEDRQTMKEQKQRQMELGETREIQKEQVMKRGMIQHPAVEAHWSLAVFAVICRAVLSDSVG